MATRYFKGGGNYSGVMTLRGKTAGEALSGMDLVKVHTDGTIRKAQANAAGTQAIGFVLRDYASGATNVVVYRYGEVDGFSSLTVAGRVYLSAASAGAVTQTQPATTNLIQTVGIATAADTILFDIPPPSYVTGAAAIA